MTGVQTCALPICFPVTIGSEAAKKEAKQNAKEEIKLAKEAEQEDADMLRAAKVEEGSVKEGENKYEYQKKVAEVKNQAAARQRKVDIAMATAQIPMAILSAFVGTPGGVIAKSIAAAIAVAFAIANVALIASAPLPKFKQGGSVMNKLGLMKGAKHEQGGIPISFPLDLQELLGSMDTTPASTIPLSSTSSEVLPCDSLNFYRPLTLPRS